MAFSFSNAAQGGATFGGQGTGGVQILDGPDLQEIQTDEIGFQSVSGEAKLKLLPSPWPSDNLPSPTASLLSVASSKGLLAAAGPDCLIVATIESTRTALRNKSDENIKVFEPSLKLNIPRISQVAFSADEGALVISPENGGLLVYEVDSLLQGKTEPILRIPTENTGLRALVPNPALESAELFAAVTSNGALLLVDLKSRSLRNGPNGVVFQSGVSCLSWSNKGKQLVAGLADGTISQIKPDGVITAEIPKPPSLEDNKHVSAVSWLENDIFLAVYTPNDTTSDGMAPMSDYFIISRQSKPPKFTYQRLPEVVPSFGTDRLPSFQFILRLRNFKPSLNELLLIASTSSTDVGVITKSGKPLSQDDPVTDDFTCTIISEDTRRAQLPLSMEQGDTWPIGFAFDLSSKETIYNPIPGEPEIRETAGPVPNLLLLNHEGILVSWWVIYADSIREKTTFSGLISESAPTIHQEDAPQPIALPQTSSLQSNGPAKPEFGNSTSFGKPPTSTFGAQPTQPFGSGSTTFGTSSTLGGVKPSWTNTGFGSSNAQPGGSGFGQPAFGSSTSIGGAVAPAFGSSTTLGSRPSPFGQAPASTFGQPAQTFGGGSPTSPFVSKMAEDTKPSGFSAFAKTGGFSSFDKAKPTSEGSFGQATGDSPFAKPSQPIGFGAQRDSGFGFEGTKSTQSTGTFGVPNATFKLNSTFEADNKKEDDNSKPSSSDKFGFGTGLTNLLEESKSNLSPTHDREAEMDDDNEIRVNQPEQSEEKTAPQTKPTSLVTPPSTIMQTKSTPAGNVFGLFGVSNQTSTTPANMNGFLGTSTKQDTTPAPIHEVKPNWGFETIQSTTPKESPIPKQESVTKKSTTPEESKPKIKAEPLSDDDTQDLSNIPEAPLPPDITSKTSYTVGDASVSSINSKTPSDDAPLPPDFAPANRNAIQGADEAELPDDDGEFSSSYDGSEEDASQEISPIEEHSVENTEQIQTSPESSFGQRGNRSPETSPTGGLFTKVTTFPPQQKSSRQLFGEVGAGPIFPPPKPQESPRSPSPVRNFLSNDLTRPESTRSVSAPSRPSAIEQRRKELGKSNLGAQQITVNDLRKQDEQRVAAAMEARAKAQAEEAQSLEDDEDDRLRAELARPVSPTEILESFIYHDPSKSEEVSKPGIPGQIERLYQDINAMIDTLGINARSLSAFLLYQQERPTNENWPKVLDSETPLDSLNDEWVLGDISRLPEGTFTLERLLERTEIENIASKLQKCHEYLGKDLVQLRLKLISLRKAIYARLDADNSADAPLSSEQLSLQHDLRKESTAVQTKLAQVEQNLAILRAKLAEAAPLHGDDSNGTSKPMLGRGSSQKKPTVEAVTNTIAKMTAMAERKSTDIDFLESQLKKLGLGSGGSINGSRQGSVEPNGTPQQGQGKLESSTLMRTPVSASGSIYHTPDSKFGTSTRQTPSSGRKSFRTSVNGTLVSTEDKERWREKNRKKQEIQKILKEALIERRKKTRAGKQA